MSLSTTEESRCRWATPPNRGDSVWTGSARLLALAAAVICVYLAWAAIAAGGRVAGCGGDVGGDCAGVLLSRWARWFGVPVAVPAAVVYCVVFIALWVLARAMTTGGGEFGMFWFPWRRSSWRRLPGSRLAIARPRKTVLVLPGRHGVPSFWP